MPLIKKANENDFSKGDPLSWFERQDKVSSSFIQNQLTYLGDSLVPITDGGVERIYKDRLNTKGEIVRYNEELFFWNGVTWNKLLNQPSICVQYDDNPFSSEWVDLTVVGTSNT